MTPFATAFMKTLLPLEGIVEYPSCYGEIGGDSQSSYPHTSILVFSSACPWSTFENLGYYFQQQIESNLLVKFWAQIYFGHVLRLNFYRQH